MYTFKIITYYLSVLLTPSYAWLTLYTFCETSSMYKLNIDYHESNIWTFANQTAISWINKEFSADFGSFVLFFQDITQKYMLIHTRQKQKQSLKMNKPSNARKTKNKESKRVT